MFWKIKKFLSDLSERAFLQLCRIPIFRKTENPNIFHGVRIITFHFILPKIQMFIPRRLCSRRTQRATSKEEKREEKNNGFLRNEIRKTTEWNSSEIHFLDKKKVQLQHGI